MKAITVNSQKCVGCRICEQWCSVGHFNVVSHRKSRISVIRSSDYMNSPLVCRQCTDTPCIDACPYEIRALSKDASTGAVLVNEESCSGCGKCIRACPHGAIKKHPAYKFVLVCNLCGGDPLCVKHCPEQAVNYTE